ncbi:MAG: hypothetical protein C4520_03640 [Candidatus Abyssobacteria bacterium SURF_5]|uniref:Uncharacterized protein n=1 Tax=Abyssobacteria bacterium (strain SURF_5) TaxID=2093360 RepID=A0A3A4P1H1_ABYX5|nr:MAG: hypothetical protein C4520_03640 [Candidatus Abyssubacteria bacterium SURF_5]
MTSKLSRQLCLPEDVEAIYRDFDNYLRHDPARMRKEVQDYEKTAAESHLRYAGMALLVAFYPFIVTEEQVQYISGVAESMIRLMEKITHLFLKEPAIRRQFNFSAKQLELIEADPGYRRAIPCARFDSFYDGAGLRFSELNTDGSSGMDGADRIARIFLSSPAMKEFFGNSNLRLFSINQCVLEALLTCYKEYSGQAAPPKPRIAIVDWKEVRTIEEFYGFAEFCRQSGYETIVADPRELEYDGRSLSHRGQRIDLIYRRVVSREFVERLEEVRAMARAFVDQNVCVVGSFRSDVAFSKRAFAVVQNPALYEYFTEEERRLVAAHVPWTHLYKDEEIEHGGQRIRIPELAKEKQEDFVLKPSYLYEGRGVKVGSLTNRKEWEDLTVSALNNDYVIQERIDIPAMPVAVWNDQMRMEERWIHLGEFVFGGRFCGLYCRAANKLVIDRRSKELLVPCLIMNP